MKLLLMLFCAASMRAFAVTLESETALGRATVIEELNASGDFPKADRKEKSTTYSWNAGYTSLRSTSTDSITGAKITDHTNDFAGGLGLETPKKLLAEFGLDYSNTPDENLADFGPNASVGYTYEFSGDGTGGAKNEKEFRPDLTAKISFASLDYVQTFTKTASRRKGVTRPASGNNTIRQNSFGFILIANPRDWITVRAAEVVYSYNKNVENFLAFLDSSRGLKTRAGGLSSTVTGFPLNETQVKLTFYIAEDWTFALTEIMAKSVVDDSLAWTTKGLVSHDLSDAWSIGLGYQNENSPQVKDHLLLVDVKFLF